MMLPLLFAASLITTHEVPGMATVHIPMPAMITPNEELRFDIPYQIPELNWNMQRF